MSIMIYILALVSGWLAGTLAVLFVCALRGRVDLWTRHLFYCAPFWSMPVFLVYRLGWFSLLTSVATFGVVFLALWMDSRKKFPSVVSY